MKMKTIPEKTYNNIRKIILDIQDLSEDDITISYSRELNSAIWTIYDIIQHEEK